MADDDAVLYATTLRDSNAALGFFTGANLRNSYRPTLDSRGRNRDIR
jgi:hypothetical protein